MGEKEKVLQELKDAFRDLRLKVKAENIMPEVRINFVYALPDASKIDDIAGFPGRISEVGEKLISYADPMFGASLHVATAVLSMMKRYPELRSAINIRYEKTLVRKALERNFVIGEIDRKEEPEEIKRVEGKSTAWGIDRALKSLERPPDLIYDLGDYGKEPMILTFGKNPSEVVRKVIELVE